MYSERFQGTGSPEAGKRPEVYPGECDGVLEPVETSRRDPDPRCPTRPQVGRTFTYYPSRDTSPSENRGKLNCVGSLGHCLVGTPGVSRHPPPLRTPGGSCLHSYFPSITRSNRRDWVGLLRRGGSRDHHLARTTRMEPFLSVVLDPTRGETEKTDTA